MNLEIIKTIVYILIMLVLVFVAIRVAIKIHDLWNGIKARKKGTKPNKMLKEIMGD